MKKKLIKIILQIRNKLPENYHFYFIGFISYIYLYIYILNSKINLNADNNKYQNEINFINKANKKVFVFIPSTDWHDLKQRPQHLAKAFALSGNIVIFLTKNQTLDRVNGIQQIFENFYLCSNPLLVNFINNTNIIFIGPSNYPLLKYFNSYKNIVYDFPDELDFFPGLSKKIIKKYHIELLKKSNLITPSASFLDDLVKTDYKCSNTKIILNGVFPNDFIIESFENIIPIEIKNILEMNKKIVGFYGGLGEKRIDFELLKYLVNNRKQYIFLIIGGGNIEHIIEKYNFSENDNLFFLGPKKYENLKHFAKFFDVALIPFLLNDFTLGVSPIKSFEYMVQGLPFISTGLPECRKYNHVLIGENYEDFLSKIDIGIELKNNSEYINGLKMEGENNTWISRANLIIKSLYNE